MPKITTKQRKFIEAYAGNGTEAARIAGYAGNDETLAQVAAENLRKPYIAHEIKRREDKQILKLIATREERQIFWTKYMKDEATELRERRKFSEILGRSQGDFAQKIELEFKDGLADRLAAARKRRAK